ncbi:DNA integrity scanning diadenylate cyclase DisA [Candidatus Pacearchaeota archaeon]|nr:DNA integrity scanning diadenylate cyclase DisA [Candidatus Pacearchaeota archaeon]
MKEKNVKKEEIVKVSQKKVKAKKEKDFVDVLKMFAPGTSIRTALNDLLRARMGALIVIDNGDIEKIIEKGFRINVKFSPQKLVELSKMDGAIILSNDLKKVFYANTLLFPSQEISTKETGTRHKAAERTAKQAQTIVVAISERRNKMTLYYKETSYELAASSEILRRATETLQTLEKQKEIFNDSLDNLNLLELKRLVTINDVSAVLQRLEIIKRISNIIKKYLAELGKEGMVINMGLKESIKNLDKEEKMILKDYFGANHSFASKLLSKMDFDFLLEPMNISRMLFEELHDKPISPKGSRILSKINFLERYSTALINKFKKLDNLLVASDEELFEVLENEGLVTFFKEEIYNLRERISVGKRI